MKIKIDIADVGLMVILGGMVYGSLKFYFLCGQYANCMVQFLEMV